jgi:hypothetical protein
MKRRSQASYFTVDADVQSRVSAVDPYLVSEDLVVVRVFLELPHESAECQPDKPEA